MRILLCLGLAACAFDPDGYATGGDADGAGTEVDARVLDGPVADAEAVADAAVVDAAVADAAVADAAVADAAVVDAGAPDATPPLPCPPSYTQLGDQGHAYRYYASGRRWTRAQERCESDGTHLLVLDGTLAENLAERALVLGLLPSSGSATVWIGLSDRDDEGLWRTVTDVLVPVDQLPWLDGEPNNFFNAEDCAEMTVNSPMNPDESGRLNDAACGLQRPYVCECD